MEIFRIKDKSQDPITWLNELHNINLNLNNIMGRYDRDEDEIKGHMFDILPEEYKPVHIYCSVNTNKMAYRDLKKKNWLWKTELGGKQK